LGKPGVALLIISPPKHAHLNNAIEAKIKKGNLLADYSYYSLNYTLYKDSCILQ